jgi:hypothetical protein
MIWSLVATAALCSASGIPSMRVAPFRSDSLTDLFQRGKSWSEFLEAAKARKEMWHDNYANGAPEAAMVDRAKAVGGAWRLLVVAEDWCGDSANTVPYLARLVEQVSSLDLRIVNSSIGKWVMERHRTADGRAATPTMVLLDSEGRDLGCFVERPAALRAWAAENKPKLSEDDYQKGKMAWYKSDRGKQTVAEFVEILETAASGGSKCGDLAKP